jgi:hypothetical protein
MTYGNQWLTVCQVGAKAGGQRGRQVRGCYSVEDHSAKRDARNAMDHKLTHAGFVEPERVTS